MEVVAVLAFPRFIVFSPLRVAQGLWLWEGRLSRFPAFYYLSHIGSCALAGLVPAELTSVSDRTASKNIGLNVHFPIDLQKLPTRIYLYLDS